VCWLSNCIGLLADIKAGQITGLIFSKLARLARNTRELLDFADYFRSHSADLVSLQESIDSSSPAGRLFYTMIAAMAPCEREEIAERVKTSISVRAKLRKPLGGPSPYGYEWKDRKLVEGSTEAPIRKCAYELFREHHRKAFVARLLNEADYRTRAGCKWSNIAVGRILGCPSAKGVYFVNRTHKLGSWNHEPKPEHEWGTLTLEPLVSEEPWTGCNRILEEQSKTERRPGRRSSRFGALSGFHRTGVAADDLPAGSSRGYLGERLAHRAASLNPRHGQTRQLSPRGCNSCDAAWFTGMSLG
jgi:site-specific DNA recombinase